MCDDEKSFFDDEDRSRENFIQDTSRKKKKKHNTKIEK